MSESITLALGEKTFVVRPLGIGPLRRVFEAIQDETLQKDGIGQCLAVLDAALAEDHPEVKAENEFRGSIYELKDQMNAVLRLAGLELGEDAAGKAAGAASTGT